LGDADRLAKIVLVLDPVQVNAEARELSWFEMALVEEGTKSLDNLGSGESRGGLLGVIDLQNHDKSRNRIMGGS